MAAPAQHRGHMLLVNCMEALWLFEQHLQNCNVYLSVFNLKHVKKAHYYYTFRERKKNPPQTPKPYHQNQPVLNHTSVWRTILKKSQENFDVQLNNCYLPDILHHYNFLKKTWKILNKCLDLGCYKD